MARGRTCWTSRSTICAAAPAVTCGETGSRVSTDHVSAAACQAVTPSISFVAAACTQHSALACKGWAATSAGTSTEVSKQTLIVAPDG